MYTFFKPGCLVMSKLKNRLILYHHQEPSRIYFYLFVSFDNMSYAAAGALLTISSLHTHIQYLTSWVRWIYVSHYVIWCHFADVFVCPLVFLDSLFAKSSISNELSDPKVLSWGISLLGNCLQQQLVVNQGVSCLVHCYGYQLMKP